MASEETDKDIPSSIRIYSDRIAGTVKAVDDDHVVLQDVVMITEHRKQSGTPIFNKVPYASRLFRRTGIARVGKRVPGDVTIEKSRILNAVELTQEEFSNLPIEAGFERLGVDFADNAKRIAHERPLSSQKRAASRS